MTPEVAIYLYGAASGATALLITLAVIRTLSRWLSRDDREFTGIGCRCNVGSHVSNSRVCDECVEIYGRSL